ncbi:MAG: DUF4397 domain-containing protein [Gemmatimonadaceae bacterium]|nr:DUF4397 domain-containing protein [Gemmatimonadaceae bacterium]
MRAFSLRPAAAVFGLAALAACSADAPVTPAADASQELAIADVALAAEAESEGEAASRSSDDNATVYVVHGINGADLRLPTALPVDVEVNGACALPGFTFRTIAGPLSLPEGAYDIRVRLAAKPACSGTAVISVDDLPLAAGANVSIVAHLSAAGAPTASVFENDVDAAPGRAKIAARHVAQFGAVDVGLNGARPFAGVLNGQGGSATVAPGRATVAIFPAGAASAALTQAVTLRGNELTAYYAVGTPSNGTFELLEQRLKLERPARARFSVLHGIDGRDLGLARHLPVDVEINGACAMRHLTFGEATRTRTVPAGTYNIVVRLAGGRPCSGAAAITANGVTLAGHTTYTIAAHLSAAGAPTASVFVNEDIAGKGLATVAARHTAQFGAVDVRANGATAFAGVTNGQGGAAAIPNGFFRLEILPASSSTVAFSGKALAIGGRFVNAFYAVGTPANGTFRVLRQRVIIPGKY